MWFRQSLLSQQIHQSLNQGAGMVSGVWFFCLAPAFAATLKSTRWPASARLIATEKLEILGSAVRRIAQAVLMNLGILNVLWELYAPISLAPVSTPAESSGSCNIVTIDCFFPRISTGARLFAQFRSRKKTAKCLSAKSPVGDWRFE